MAAFPVPTLTANLVQCMHLCETCMAQHTNFRSQNGTDATLQKTAMLFLSCVVVSHTCAAFPQVPCLTAYLLVKIND